MTRGSLVSLLLLLGSLGCGGEGDPLVVTRTPIRINELASRNNAYGDLGNGYGDWIELYNAADEDFDLDGCFISDSMKKRFKDSFVAGTIVPAGGVLLVWADGSTDPITAREPHLSFRLSTAGEGVWLSNPAGYVVDSVEFGTLPEQSLDTDRTSLARFPDGSGGFAWCSAWSPEELNGDACAGAAP